MNVSRLALGERWRAALAGRQATRPASQPAAAQRPPPAQPQTYLIEVPRDVRLYQIADFAAGISHRLHLAGEGRRLRLVPIKSERRT